MIMAHGIEYSDQISELPANILSLLIQTRFEAGIPNLLRWFRDWRGAP
jgi:hypothetical protein